MDIQKLDFLKEKAIKIRKITMEMIGTLGVGHAGGALSVIDALTVLYYDLANVDSQNPKDPDRDRIIMSKGHAGPALYSILAEKGYFPFDEIHTLNKSNTNLPSHCDMNKTVGIDMTAGSLGQGLSCAVGMALAGKMDKKSYQTYCFLGDGESQEGQVWEALMYAGNLGLDNLTIFLDNNKCQLDDYTDKINSIEPFDLKAKAFKFNTIRIDGHDLSKIYDAIVESKTTTGKCTLIILDTIKGKGVDWIEAKGAGSHSVSISEAQWRDYCQKENN